MSPWSRSSPSDRWRGPPLRTPLCAGEQRLSIKERDQKDDRTSSKVRTTNRRGPERNNLSMRTELDSGSRFTEGDVKGVIGRSGRWKHDRKCSSGRPTGLKIQSITLGACAHGY